MKRFHFMLFILFALPLYTAPKTVGGLAILFFILSFLFKDKMAFTVFCFNFISMLTIFLISIDNNYWVIDNKTLLILGSIIISAVFAGIFLIIYYKLVYKGSNVIEVLDQNDKLIYKWRKVR